MPIFVTKFRFCLVCEGSTWLLFFNFNYQQVVFSGHISKFQGSRVFMAMNTVYVIITRG